MKGLYAAKGWYTRRLSRVVAWCVAREVSPDTLTVAGVACAAGGGVALAFGWWPLAWILIAGRLAGANLDGAVARERGVSRPFGFVVNEIGDRLGDLALAAGLVGAAYLTPGGLPAVAWAAMAAAGIPTFVSLSGAAVGVARLNGGPFGKTERCLAYAIASVGAALGSGMSVNVVAAFVIAGSIVTGVARALAIRRSLHDTGAEESPP